ncbi:hypothetical protein Leryth_013437 [Lithospermum erythrorhizon]|nr:hypothetical protein Leryth_013437 [Lithospermum erythrorhizon]
MSTAKTKMIQLPSVILHKTDENKVNSIPRKTITKLSTIKMRGKQPSFVDCLMQENVAVIIARLAIRAAILEIRNTGQKAPPAATNYNASRNGREEGLCCISMILHEVGSLTKIPQKKTR